MAVRPDLNRSHTRTKSLSSQGKTLRKSLEQSFELNNLLEGKLEAQTADLESLAKVLNDRDKERKRLQNQLKDANRSIQDLSQCNSDLQVHISQVQGDYESLLTKYDAVMKRLEQWELSGQVIKRQAEELTGIGKEQKEKMKELQAENQHLEAAKEVFRGKYEVALKEIRELNEKITELASIPHVSTTQKSVQTTMVQGLESQVPSPIILHPALSVLQKENLDLHQKCTDLACQLAGIQSRYSLLRSKSRSSRPQSVELTQSYQSTGSRIKDGVQDYIHAITKGRK